MNIVELRVVKCVFTDVERNICIQKLIQHYKMNKKSVIFFVLASNLILFTIN